MTHLKVVHRPAGDEAGRRQETANRTAFIDHLRVALTALVVFDHAAITYGAAGRWYLREAPEASSIGLTLFVTVNQAFFMGFFFLVAGYFTPGPYDRKGPMRFLVGRLLRLGVPLLVFSFVLHPLTVALVLAHSPAAVVAIWFWFMAHGLFSNGPLWFAQALLIFVGAYILWRALGRGAAGVTRPLPGHATLLAAALAVGIGAFLLRLVWPVGTAVSNLQICYFASYIVLFCAGVAGARDRWLERVALPLVVPWLLVSAVALAALVTAVGIAGIDGFEGGWTVKAAIYAFFEPFFAWGVILGLLMLFRTRFNVATRWSRFLSARAYTVYIVHAPVLIAVARAVEPLAVPGFVKFLLAGTLTCAASVLVAGPILRIRGSDRVL